VRRFWDGLADQKGRRGLQRGRPKEFFGACLAGVDRGLMGEWSRMGTAFRIWTPQVGVFCAGGHASLGEYSDPDREISPPFYSLIPAVPFLYILTRPPSSATLTLACVALTPQRPSRRCCCRSPPTHHLSMMASMHGQQSVRPPSPYRRGSGRTARPTPSHHSTAVSAPRLFPRGRKSSILFVS
jgi:hypothetical protein